MPKTETTVVFVTEHQLTFSETVYMYIYIYMVIRDLVGLNVVD
jgi:hypothetical protein